MASFIVIFLFINIFFCVFFAIKFNKSKNNECPALCISTAFSTNLCLFILALEIVQGA